MKEQITVMVTGVGGGGHGEQILKALRMSELNYKIIGADMNSYSKGLQTVDIPYILPPARERRYMEELLDICTKNKVKALFHGSEAELKIMSQHREAIRAAGILLPINSANVIDICMNKSCTFDFLHEHGFTVPQTMIIESLKQINGWNRFPAILKPSVDSGGSAHTYIVQSKEELSLIGEYILKAVNTSEIIIQEYCGTSNTEYTVGVLHDMDGNLINSIALHRDLSSSLSCRTRLPNHSGNIKCGQTLSISTGISQGEIGPFPEVCHECERIANALGSCGPLNIQCRVQDGKVFVFEINPRFSGTTSIRALVGYNEPDILIRKHILGEEIQRHFAYQSAVVVRGLEESVLMPQKTGGE